MEPVRIPIVRQLHSNRRKVVVVSLAVAVVTVSIFLGLSLNSVATINVTGVQVQTYIASPAALHYVTVKNYTWNFKTLGPGERFHFTFQITNPGGINETAWNFKVETGGFALISSGEPLSFTILPHSSESITLTIRAPLSDYAGSVVLALSLGSFYAV